MQQQINLYQFIPKPIQSWINVKTLSLSYAALLTILLVVYFYGLHDKNQRLIQVTEINTRLHSAQQHLIDVVGQYPQLIRHQSLKGVGGISACQTQFSNYLAGFSEAIVPGVWLTQITISVNGQLFELKGNAIKAIYVQQFLDKLKQQAIFSRLTVGIQTLSKSSATASVLNFNITAKASTNG